MQVLKEKLNMMYLQESEQVNKTRGVDKTLDFDDLHDDLEIDKLNVGKDMQQKPSFPERPRVAAQGQSGYNVVIC